MNYAIIFLIIGILVLGVISGCGNRNIDVTGDLDNTKTIENITTDEIVNNTLSDYVNPDDEVELGEII